MYLSSADFFLEIVVPYLLPLCLIPTWVNGPYTNAALLSAGMLGGLYEHSDYNLWPGTYMFDTTPHNTHHRICFGPGVNFADGVGSFGVLDSACGTVATDYHLVAGGKQPAPCK